MEETQTDMDTQINPLLDIPPNFSPAPKIKLSLRDEMAAVKMFRKFKLSISPRVINILDTLMGQGKINEIYRDRIIHVLDEYLHYITLPSNRDGVLIDRKNMMAIFGPNYEEVSSHFFVVHTKDLFGFGIKSGVLRYKIRDEFVNDIRSYPVTRFGTELQRLIYEDARIARYVQKNKNKRKKLEELYTKIGGIYKK